MSKRYESKVYWDGEIPRIQVKDQFIEWLKQYPSDSWFRFVVEPLGSLNDGKQQRLYHKWCDIIHQEYGWDSRQEIHEYFKATYNNGESTTGMDTRQWSEYMLKIQAFAAENNIILPTGLS